MAKNSLNRLDVYRAIDVDLRHSRTGQGSAVGQKLRSSFALVWMINGTAILVGVLGFFVVRFLISQDSQAIQVLAQRFAGFEEINIRELRNLSEQRVTQIEEEMQALNQELVTLRSQLNTLQVDETQVQMQIQNMRVDLQAQMQQELVTAPPAEQAAIRARYEDLMAQREAEIRAQAQDVVQRERDDIQQRIADLQQRISEGQQEIQDTQVTTERAVGQQEVQLSNAQTNTELRTQIQMAQTVAQSTEESVYTQSIQSNFQQAIAAYQQQEYQSALADLQQVEAVYQNLPETIALPSRRSDLSFVASFRSVIRESMTNLDSAAQDIQARPIYQRGLQAVRTQDIPLASRSFRTVIQEYPLSTLREDALSQLETIYSTSNTASDDTRIRQLEQSLSNANARVQAAEAARVQAEQDQSRLASQNPVQPQQTSNNQQALALQRLQSEKQAVDAQLASTRGELLAAQQAQSDANLELNNLQAQTTDAQSSLEAAQSQVQDLQTQLDNLQNASDTERNILQLQLQEARNAQQQAQAQLAQFEQQTRTLLARARAAETSLSDAQNQIRTLEANQQRLAASLESQTRLAEQRGQTLQAAPPVAELQASNTQAAQALATYQNNQRNLEGQVQSLNQRIATLTAQYNRALQDKLAAEQRVSQIIQSSVGGQYNQGARLQQLTQQYNEAMRLLQEAIQARRVAEQQAIQARQQAAVQNAAFVRRMNVPGPEQETQAAQLVTNGLQQMQSQEFNAAFQTFSSVIRDYPNTDGAEVAFAQLQILYRAAVNRGTAPVDLGVTNVDAEKELLPGALTRVGEVVQVRSDTEVWAVMDDVSTAQVGQKLWVYRQLVAGRMTRIAVFEVTEFSPIVTTLKMISADERVTEGDILYVPIEIP